MDLILFMSQMLDVPSTALGTTIHEGMTIAGAIGKVMGKFQMMKLQKRVEENAEQLQVIKKKIEDSENEVFYKQEVFPLIAKQLMSDDEDTKAKVIIDGFEYAVDNEINEIERIYHYYDVLAELRYSDIVMLVKSYMPPDMRKNFNLNMNLAMPSEVVSGKYQEKQAFKTYQKNKLVRLGLLENRVREIDGGNGTIEEVTRITSFGRRFLLFFALED